MIIVRQGEKHGDIRRDHIIIDRESGNYRWIDFDFNYRHRENIYGYDLFGIAVDGSDNSRRAVVYAGGLIGGRTGFTATLLHVIHAPEEDFFSSPQERERWVKSGRKKVARWITEYRDLLIADGVDAGDVSIRTAERDGPSLARLILAEMKSLEAGTIVLGRQGLSPKEEFLFGSVSKQIVSYARNCTVWVVQ